MMREKGDTKVVSLEDRKKLKKRAPDAALTNKPQPDALEQFRQMMEELNFPDGAA